MTFSLTPNFFDQASRIYDLWIAYFIGLVAVGAVLIHTSSAVALSNECSAEKAVGSCEILKRAAFDANGSTKLKLPKFEDGSTIYNDYAQKKPSRIGSLNLSPALIKRAEALTKKSREAAKALVAGDTRSDLLTAEQKAMLVRLESVRIRVADDKDEDCRGKNSLDRIAPNARYEDTSHTVVVCPSAARLAPSALLMVVTHEFGHVISPCVMAKDFYKISSELAASARSPRALQNCLKTHDERELASELFTGTNSSLSPLQNLKPAYKSVVMKLAECGLLSAQETQGRFKRSGLFKELQTCLDQRYQANWERNKNKTKASSNIESNPSLQCQGVYEEHFSDAFGARVFSKTLEESKTRRDDARVGLVEMASYTCSDKGRREDPGGPSDYPLTSDRLMLQMADPETQAALGCVLPRTKSPLCTLENFRPNVGPTVERQRDGYPSPRETEAVQ